MAAYRIRLSPASCGIELAKAFVCAALTHAFGCTVNDIADYRFDALVGTPTPFCYAWDFLT